MVEKRLLLNTAPLANGFGRNRKYYRMVCPFILRRSKNGASSLGKPAFPETVSLPDAEYRTI